MYAFSGGCVALERVQPIVLAENLGTIRVFFFFLAQTEDTPDKTIEASQEDIARATNLGRQAVKLAISRLLELGMLAQLRPGCNGHFKACYRFTLPESYPHENQPAESQPPDFQPTETLDSNIESNNSLDLNSYNFHVEIESRVESPAPKPDKPASTSHKEQPLLLWSSFLLSLSRDYSRELGDDLHVRSNSAQTLNLWRKSELGEKDFAARMYQARALTLRYAVHRPGETPPPPGQPRNRMPYFFAVLRNLLDQNNAAPQPQPQATPQPKTPPEILRHPALPNFRGAEALRQARRG